MHLFFLGGGRVESSSVQPVFFFFFGLCFAGRESEGVGVCGKRGSLRCLRCWAGLRGRFGCSLGSSHFGFGSFDLGTLNPKPKTLNPKPLTLNLPRFRVSVVPGSTELRGLGLRVQGFMSRGSVRVQGLEFTMPPQGEVEGERRLRPPII